MKEQKVVITDSGESINMDIKDGWRVVSVTAQHVSVSTNAHADYLKEFGKFCFVLEK